LADACRESRESRGEKLSAWEEVMVGKLRTLVVAVALIVLGADSATAQAPLRKSAPDTRNPCAGVESDGLASCGMEAFRMQNYEVARSAWSRAAEQGDHVAAMWLAGLYEDGDLGEKDYVQAYKWYDIAAYIHGTEIERQPPGANENNQQAINYRDATGQKLTADQLADAQKQAREWLKRTKRSH
jgi:hypothetical protein